MDPLQVLAEPRRRAILRLIWDAERPAGEIAEHFDVTFGAVSQHLGVLREAGFVTVRRDANRRLYRADQTALKPFRHTLEAMWRATLDDLASAVEGDQERRRGR